MSNSKNIRREYSIILGCPRSGTTFLTECLKSLPNTECIIGHHIPVAITHIIGKGELSKELNESISHGFFSSVENHMDSKENDILNSFRLFMKKKMSSREFIKTLLRRRQVYNIIYKEPFLAFSPKFAFNSFPECKIIHIVRDGRDCANSLVRNYDALSDEKLKLPHTTERGLCRKYGNLYIPWWVQKGKERQFIESSQYVRCVWMWKEMVKSVISFNNKPEIKKNNRVLFLRYEDLVNNPIKEGNKVIKFLESHMNKRTKKMLNEAKSSSIGLYKRRSEMEISKATEIAKRELKAFGYE